MRHYIFTWKENKKYSKTERKNKITVSNASTDDGISGKQALSIFIANFGNLKKNDIISIQEVNDKGENVGEIITPAPNSAILPTI